MPKKDFLKTPSFSHAQFCFVKTGFCGILYVVRGFITALLLSISSQFFTTLCLSNCLFVAALAILILVEI